MTDKGDTMLRFYFDLSPSDLLVVDDEEGLRKVEQALADCVILGIDTETKPCFSPKANKFVGARYPTALVQIASRSSSGREAVFILDLLTLAKRNFLQAMDRALGAVLLDANCVKVGQSLINDFRELRAAYPHVKAFQEVHGIVDTTVLVKVLQPELTHSISLKNMVKQYLHFELAKKQQLSDWSRRPLSPAQIHYAACDALVLLRLYDAMLCEAEEQTIESAKIFDVKSCMESFTSTITVPDIGCTDASETSSQSNSCVSEDASKKGGRAANKSKRANISRRVEVTKKIRVEDKVPEHKHFK